MYLTNLEIESGYVVLTISFFVELQGLLVAGDGPLVVLKLLIQSTKVAEGVRHPLQVPKLLERLEALLQARLG
ncbi:hypothetical protein ES703_92549 [subsurface metagenome]